MILRCIALLYVLFIAQHKTTAQNNTEVMLMDFVKIKNGKRAEALYFYENNWKLYREAALKKNIIKSYQLVAAAPDSLQNFDLILITVYADSLQHRNSEENFSSILKELRPNGPVLLNELRPADFRQNVFVKIVKPVFSPAKKERND